MDVRDATMSTASKALQVEMSFYCTCIIIIITMITITITCMFYAFLWLEVGYVYYIPIHLQCCSSLPTLLLMLCIASSSRPVQLEAVFYNTKN